MILKKRRRAVTSPIEKANQKSDEDFVAAFLAPGAPDTPPWTATWTHPETNDSYSLSLARSANVGEDVLESCFDLIEETSRADYDASVQKWRPADKRREMREVDLRYIIVRKEQVKPKTEGSNQQDLDKGQDQPDQPEQQERQKRQQKDQGQEQEHEKEPGSDESQDQNQPQQQEHEAEDTSPRPDPICGFTSLMPTYEEGQPVVYCYEIHLKPELKGTGLAALLMGFLSTVAYNLPPISKVMLTCFLSNKRAMRFYQKQGFRKDEISPEARALRGKTFMPDYTIMSKIVNR